MLPPPSYWGAQKKIHPWMYRRKRHRCARFGHHQERRQGNPRTHRFGRPQTPRTQKSQQNQKTFLPQERRIRPRQEIRRQKEIYQRHWKIQIESS
jgi:hypothetical protein